MSSLVVWCRIIIDHRAADHHKRCQRRPLSFTDISPTGSVDLPAQASEQEDDRIEQIHAALLELPASQAEAFRMRHFVGWHYARIAAIQRCTVKTARWRVFRARRRLAARFRIDPESLGDEPDSP